LIIDLKMIFVSDYIRKIGVRFTESDLLGLPDPVGLFRFFLNKTYRVWKTQQVWKPLQLILILLLACMLLFSCQQNYVPKPHAYFRIDFPEKEYQMYDNICPFTFEYPVYGKLIPDTRPTSEPCWFNIDFPKYRGTIYLSYWKIDSNFDRFIEDDWRMIYGGIAQMADAVDPVGYENSENKVFGTLYDIKGNAASAVQFFVTDSVKNFLRGSLYFATRPNHDSLAPAISFFREDIDHLMKTIRWKEVKTKK
jgi:gliding motility-associated lipoprotein GldD